jgi:hypothetical protein
MEWSKLKHSIRKIGKVEELYETVKECEKVLRKYEWNIQDICNTMKRPNLQIMGIAQRQLFFR